MDGQRCAVQPRYGGVESLFHGARRGRRGEGAPALLPTGGLVENFSLSNDGKYLYYSTNAEDIDRRHIWRVPTGGGPAEHVTTGHDIECEPAVLASGNQVALFR